MVFFKLESVETNTVLEVTHLYELPSPSLLFIVACVIFGYV